MADVYLNVYFLRRQHVVEIRKNGDIVDAILWRKKIFLIWRSVVFDVSL